jgi:Nif-specific regulatory protein
VFPIHVPPLRERGNDILLLAEEFVRRFAKRHGKRSMTLAPDATRWLLSHTWPGNVRELQNCLERAVTLCEPGGRLTVEQMQPAFGPRAPAAGGGAATRTLREALDAAERVEIQRALDACDGRVAAAARRLGVSRQHLHTLQRKHGLKPSTRRVSDSQES